MTSSTRTTSKLRTRVAARRGLALRLLVVLGALFLLAPEAATSQQLGEGMRRHGIVGIQNDVERKVFFSLLCTCGCPRETLGTCTCDFAHARRAELREMLEDGLGMDAIHAAYVDRFGVEALAVPPNVGAARAVWALPLVALVLGAGFVVLVLRRWRGKGPPNGPPTKPGDEGKRDHYDDRLDDELEELDRS